MISSSEARHAVFEHVVVGIDGYGRAAQLAPVLEALAPGAAGTLVSVFPAATEAARSDGEIALREQALAMLSSERINASLPDAEILVVADLYPANGLRRAAAERTADLLVIGPSARSPLGRIVLGQVGRDVFHGASCPVLIVPAQARPAADHPRSIGVAFDGSPEALHALALAAKLAAPLGSRLEVTEVVDVDDGRTFSGEGRSEFVRGVCQTAQARLFRAVEGIPGAVRAEVVAGEVRQVLGDLGGRVDLMVCGSRGWGPAAQVAFGSVADDLISDARCPVLVTPRGAHLPTAVTSPEEGPHA